MTTVGYKEGAKLRGSLSIAFLLPTPFSCVCFWPGKLSLGIAICYTPRFRGFGGVGVKGANDKRAGARSRKLHGEPVWLSGKALGYSKQKGLGSIPLQLSFLFKKVVVCGP